MIERQKKRKLGEILVENGVLTKENLEEALNHQKSHGGLIGQILITLGYLSEEDVVAALISQLKVPYLPLGNYSLNMEAARILDEPFCRKNFLVAFDQDDNRLFVAVSDPLNETTIEEVKKRVKHKVHVFIATATEILNMIDLAFSTGSKTDSG